MNLKLKEQKREWEDKQNKKTNQNEREKEYACSLRLLQVLEDRFFNNLFFKENESRISP